MNFVNFVNVAQTKGAVFVNFYDRFVACCNEKGKSPSGVALEIGLAKPTVNRWKNGSIPTDATSAKIASYFGVSVAYLMGKEEKQQKKPSEISLEGLSPAHAEAVKRVIQMSDAEVQKLTLLLQIVEAK